MKRLFGDFYHLSSSEGWEGVGILDRGIYRGVFRNRGKDAQPKAIGEHSIDWTHSEVPSVQTTPTTGGVGPVTQRWRRMRDASKQVVEERVPSAEQPKAGAPPTGGRPAFGEYVYVEELPEAVTKVAPPHDLEMPPGVEGTVMVQALVLEDGSVGDTRVVKSIPMLDEVAVATVRQWRFKPAKSKGVPVAVWVAVPIRFAGR